MIFSDKTIRLEWFFGSKDVQTHFLPQSSSIFAGPPLLQNGAWLIVSSYELMNDSEISGTLNSWYPRYGPGLNSSVGNFCGSGHWNQCSTGFSVWDCGAWRGESSSPSPLDFCATRWWVHPFAKLQQSSRFIWFPILINFVYQLSPKLFKPNQLFIYIYIYVYT